MQQLPTPIRSGQRVDVRGEPWLVVDVDPFPAAQLITLRGLGAANFGDTARVLTPFDRVTLTAQQQRPRQRPRMRVLQVALTAVRTTRPWTECRAALAARIEPRPWQLAPARAMLHGASRVLLADAVGLGKTIQALIVASELAERALVRRLLVLTPAALREQWAGEMRDRFGLRPVIFDHVSLASAAAELPVGCNPWTTAPAIISSIDLVKRDESRQSIDAATFDLLIVDEAHHLTPGTSRAAVVTDLAARTPFVVLVTATPHSGDREAYRLLCAIGATADDPSCAVFRRTAADVHVVRRRRTRVVSVPSSDAERALLEGVLDYAQALRRDAPSPGAALAGIVIARRACSSSAAALTSIARRRALLGGIPEPDDQPRLPWEEDVADDDLDARVIGAAGLADRASELAWLDRLAIAAKAASGHWSKLTAVRRLLARTREQLLVFSEYRDVALAAADGVADLTSVAVLHGGIAPAVRRELVTLFNRGHIRTLVSTDAAGEGLNLHQRCRLVVTLELPWNPLRIEQRIGRVDRIGQARRVHARLLVHRGSFEDLVLGHLERRRAAAAADLTASDEPLSEAQLISLVLDGGAPPCGAAPRLLTRLGAAAADVEHCGAPVTPCRVEHDGPSFAVSPPRGRPVRSVVMLFAVDLADGAGRLTQQEMLCARCAFDQRWPPPRRLTRALVRALASAAAVRSSLTEAAEDRAAHVSRTLAPISTRLAARTDGLLAALAARTGHHLFQGSLFDVPDEQRQRAREETVRRWQSHLLERRASAQALSSVSAAEPRLVAAWLDS